MWCDVWWEQSRHRERVKSHIKSPWCIPPSPWWPGDPLWPAAGSDCVVRSAADAPPAACCPAPAPAKDIAAQARPSRHGEHCTLSPPSSHRRRRLPRITKPRWMMMVRKESGRWLLRTAECEAEHRECCVWAEQNTSRITQLSCSPACTLQHSQSTLVTAPLPACCRSERGKRGGSSDNYLHLAAQEIWDLQAAKKRGCSPRSEIIYSSSVTNLKIHWFSMFC